MRTGLFQWLFQQVDNLAGRTELSLLLVLCISIAFLSALIVDTATVNRFISSGKNQTRILTFMRNELSAPTLLGTGETENDTVSLVYLTENS